MIRPPALTSIIRRPIILSHEPTWLANMSRVLSGAVQCFAAHSAYWITMNPLTTRRKALKVALRPLPLSATSREKVSPLYARLGARSPGGSLSLLPFLRIPVRWVANIPDCCTAECAPRSPMRHLARANIVPANIVAK